MAAFSTLYLPLVRQKRKRKSQPKSRGGCITCKARHVKCDEQQPFCQRCVRRGRECGGYVPLTTLIFEASTNAAEDRSYSYFVEVTSKQLTGFYDYCFWNKLILPSSKYERSIRHSLVALGSLHEFLNDQDSNPGKQTRPDFACQQYNKAICYLTRRDKPPAPEIALITCLLFLCFETLYGHNRQVSELFPQALHLIETSDYRDKQSKTIRDDILPVVVRWRTQLSTYTNYQRLSVKPLPGALEISTLDTFPSACDCLQSCNKIMDKVHVYLSPRLGLRRDDASVKEITVMFHRELAEWYGKFENFISSSSEEQKANLLFQRAILLLRVHYLVATIAISTYAFQDEMQYDAHESSFRSMNAVITQCLDVEDQISTAYPPIPGATPLGRQKRSFGLDLNLVVTLVFVSVRCRHPVIRREAIGLLKRSNRCDGLWDSAVSAVKVERIVAVEEQGIKNPTTSADIPASSRVSLQGCKCHTVEGPIRQQPGVPASGVRDVERESNLPDTNASAKDLERDSPRVNLVDCWNGEGTGQSHERSKSPACPVSRKIYKETCDEEPELGMRY